jgi:hypothetical protein
MTFTIVLCLLSIALAQDTSSSTSATTAPANSDTDAPASSASPAVNTAGSTGDTSPTTTGLTCADQVAVCQARSKKCATNLTVHCGCVKEELACVKAAGNCTEVTEGLENSSFVCFSLGCGTACEGQALDGFCNLATAATNCPYDRSACMRKAATPEARCKCEANYFDCIDGARSCRDFDTAFTGKVAECKKTCPEADCTIPNAASALAFAPIVLVVAGMFA